MICRGAAAHFIIALFGALASPLHAQTPQLAIVVSVDQLAYDYLERFHRNFDSEGLFVRCESQGLWYTNCHHRHAFTYTAPGHAVQLTGCYPSEHGIIENDWFDRATGKKIYCCADPTVKLIGTTISDPLVSPRNMLADTLGDRMKMVDRGSKVFGVAIKDRASILMCGHLADAAFWMSNDGKWITCNYYRDDLPGYFREFNEGGAIDRYSEAKWDLLLPAEKYLHGMPEDNTGERPFAGASASFPHVLTQSSNTVNYNYIKQVAGSPLGNEAALEAAAMVLEHEQLGLDDSPDLLCINLSSNDYVGHSFGPDSLEVEDMTYRTDRLLGDFLRKVESQLGDRPWILALTADHAICPIPEVSQKRGLPAGRDPLGKPDAKGNYLGISQELERVLREGLKILDIEAEPLIQAATDNEIFLVREHPELKGDRFALAQRLVRDHLLAHPGIATAVTREQLLSGQLATELDRAFRRSFHPLRSGDVLFALKPYHIHGGAGTTHGSPWNYDSHVPLLLLSGGTWKDRAGKEAARPFQGGRRTESVSPAQIAPTLASVLRITAPAKCVEEALPTN